MAAVASTDVTYVSGYELGDRNDKFVAKIKRYSIVFAANGGTADDVPASLFGYTKILYARVIRAVDGSSNLSWVNLVVEADDAGILVIDPETATDANRGNPTNYTGTVVAEIAGY